MNLRELLEILGVWLTVAVVVSLLLGAFIRAGSGEDAEIRVADHARSLGWCLVVSYAVVLGALGVGAALMYLWLRFLS